MQLRYALVTVVSAYFATPAQASGNMKTASLLVSFLYTAEKVDSLASTSPLSLSLGSNITFRSLEPSTLMRVRLPTISVGPTMSSMMDSCTDVSVRVRGRTFRPLRRKFLSKMVRFATKTTCFLENFFQLTDEPSLDLADGLPDSERKMDDHCLAHRPHLHLVGGRNVDVAQVGLDLARWRHFDVEESLRHLL